MKDDTDCIGVIRYMARNCYRRLGFWARVKYDIEDLEQEGLEVLYTVAYPRYNPSLRTCFKTWLVICLRTRYANIVKKENHFAWLREDWLCGYSEPPEESAWKHYGSSEPGAFYGLSYKEYGAANRNSPMDETIFRQAVRALLDAAPDFVELVLGTCPRAYRGRLKVFTSAVRLREKRNRTNEFRPRNIAPITGRMLARFLDHEKSFCNLKKLLYNTIKGTCPETVSINHTIERGGK